MSSPAPDWMEQARRLLAGSGLADALTSFAAGPGGTAGAGPAPGPQPADHSAECRWCPLCVGLAALRGHRPDLLEGLADVLGTAAATLRAHAAAGGGTADPPAAADAAPGERAADAAAGERAPDERAAGEQALEDRSADAPADPPAEEPGTGPTPAPVQRIEVA